MDFGFGNKGDDKPVNTGAPDANATGDAVTDLTTGKTNTTTTTDDNIDINGISDSGEVDKNKKPFTNGDTSSSDNKKPEDKSNEAQDDKSGVDLVEGSVIELGDDKYSVDATGNVVDKDGNIFKEAKDVKDWLASFDKVDETSNELSIKSIQDVVGIEITDQDNKPIEFENTPSGIKAYIDAVTEAQRDEHYEEAINTFYQKYPIITDVLNYYVANGNSLEGFGEVQDRSNITIDDSNVAQHESIIRTAWTEQNRKGDLESYIQYLKSSGTLLATAKEELTGLQENDKQVKQQLAEQAEQAEQANIEKLESYWNSVKEVIKNRSIAGYQIPENIIVVRDGKKISTTPEDFYNYIYRVDNEGKSEYQKALLKETPESRRDDELLRAYLKFSGGNYSNLVGMAVNKDKINTIKIQAKNRTTNSIKVTKPNIDQSKGKVVDLGYK